MSEVQTLVRETLATLSEFSKNLEQLSKASAKVILDLDSYGANGQTESTGPTPEQQLNRVLEGVSTFTSAIMEIKKTTDSTRLDEIRSLEIELLGILKNLISAHEKVQFEAMANLLAHRLPANLTRWRNRGLPAMDPVLDREDDGQTR